MEENDKKKDKEIIPVEPEIIDLANDKELYKKSVDSRGKFIKGNQLAKKAGDMARGVPRWKKSKEFMQLTTRLMEHYNDDKIIELMEEIPTDKRLYFIKEFAELHYKNIKHMDNIKLSKMLNKLKDKGNDTDDNITIILPSDDDDDDE